MTLDEAILHCKEIIENNSVCKDCINDHIQLLDWLVELKAYRELFKSNNLNNIALDLFGEMRDLTEEERNAYNRYIESISKPTGVNFWSLYDEHDEEK